MPSEEEQEILAKIGQLAGQINRHKNQQQSATQQPTYRTRFSQYGTASSSSNTTPSWQTSRGAYRGRGHHRGGSIPQHRNRTLVLSGSGPATTDGEINGDALTPPISTTASSSQAWVSRTDRHLQLINPAIFEKQSQERARAMEETRKAKLKQRDERERLKFSRHLQNLDATLAHGHTRSQSSAVASKHEIVVQGILFRVVKNGSKLMKVPGDENAAKATPKTAIIGGVKFFRSKNGNLYRSGIVKAQRRNGVVQKIDEPCKAFSTTGTCLKGPRCRYNHDPNNVAVCKDFLQKGTCTAGDSCDLSHDLTPERTPACLHFAKGNCSNANCRYSHIRVSPSAAVCRPFGIYGYCKKGADCTDRHVSECPDFSNTGTCSTKGCKLLHRHKASIIRKNAAKENTDDDAASDVSSDDDADEIDSDDVDSDDLNDEVFGMGDPDSSMQQDFVQF